MSLSARNRLGPYEIVSPRGAGGTGGVYRARDTRLERTVAIKILPPPLSNDAVRKQRNLNFRRTGVRIMDSVARDEVRFLLLGGWQNPVSLSSYREIHV